MLNYAHIYLATIMLKIICWHNPPRPTEGQSSWREFKYRALQWTSWSLTSICILLIIGGMTERVGALLEKQVTSLL